MNTIKNVADDCSIVLYFYADWCGFCAQTKPNWELAKRRTTDKVNWLSFDCSNRSKFPFLKRKYNIRAYPQVIGLTPKNKMGKRKMLVMTDTLTASNLNLFAATLDKSNCKRMNLSKKLNSIS